MSNRKLFNRLVKDPTTFEIKGTDVPVNARAKESLQNQLSDYIDRLESFSGDYAHHAMYDIDLDDEPNSDDTLHHGSLKNYDRELVSFRLEFMDLIHDAAKILNCDTRDIFDTFGIDDLSASRSILRLRDNKEFNDQDYLRVLSGLHNECHARHIEMETGTRYMQTAISEYLADNEDGMMYDDPDAIIPDEPNSP